MTEPKRFLRTPGQDVNTALIHLPNVCIWWTILENLPQVPSFLLRRTLCLKRSTEKRSCRELPVYVKFLKRFLWQKRVVILLRVLRELLRRSHESWYVPALETFIVFSISNWSSSRRNAQEVPVFPNSFLQGYLALMFQKSETSSKVLDFLKGTSSGNVLKRFRRFLILWKGSCGENMQQVCKLLKRFLHREPYNRFPSPQTGPCNKAPSFKKKKRFLLLKRTQSLEFLKRFLQGNVCSLYCAVVCALACASTCAQEIETY